METFPDVYVDFIPIESSFPTLTSRSSRTSTLYKILSVSAMSQPARITHTIILKMGYLAHSVGIRATRLEVAVLSMIKHDNLATLKPLRASIVTLKARFET